MNDVNALGLAGIDEGGLSQVVRQALSCDAASLLSYSAVALTPGAGMATGGILRVSGSAEASGGATAWSVILKTLLPGPPDADPAGWSYWKREADLYQSGLLDDLADGMAAPRCFGVDEQTDGALRLWLEDVGDIYPAGWPLERFALAAYHLGLLNGAYLAGKELPTHDWFSRDTLKGWIAGFLPRMPRLAEAEADPLIAAYCDASLSAGARRMVGEYASILDALTRLPQTFQHGDAHKGNLLARRRADGADETVAIDWAYAGIRAVGEEVESLISASSLFFGVDHDDVDQLSDECFAGYVDGLRTAGWLGDADLARLGFLGAATVRFTLVPIEVIFMNAHSRDWFCGITGRPFDETMRRYQAVRAWGFAQEAETRDLMRRLL